MQAKEERGRDLAVPMDRLIWAGEERRMVFDNNCYRIAEDVYELKYGRNCSIYQIMQHLAVGRIGAMMAVFYGGLVSGGLAELQWDEFSRGFRLDAIPGLQERLLAAIRGGLPDADGAKAPDPTETAESAASPGSSSSAAQPAAD